MRRFHVIDFDWMCREPDAAVSALLHFLSVPATYEETLTSLVDPPESIGRHESHLDHFGQDTVRAVNELMVKIYRT